MKVKKEKFMHKVNYKLVRTSSNTSKRKWAHFLHQTDTMAMFPRTVEEGGAREKVTSKSRF